MRARIIVAVVLVGAALAAVASTASGGTTASKQHHRLAAGGRAGSELGADREGRERRVPARASRRRRQRPVPDVGEPPPEVRRDTRGRQRTGRHRDGQHRDDEVHGRRGVPGPVVDRRLDPELEHLARRAWPRRAGSAASSTASRTTRARASSPTAPTCSRRPGSRSRRASPSSRRPRRSSAARTATKGFSPVYIAGTDWYVAMSFVADYGGTIARQVSGKWKGTLASPKAIAGLTAYKNFFTAVSRASKTTDETSPTRTTSTPRARPAR